MSRQIKIRKGKNINLVGKANATVSDAPRSATYAVKPVDFIGITPKLAVKQGDEVKAGAPLFYDKSNPELKFVSPVSGEVAEIVRGARRAIMEIRVLADSSDSHVSFDTKNWSDQSNEDFIKTLMNAGAWSMLVQRPFGTMADSTAKPKAIFISGYDSAPLGVDFNVVLKGKENEFQTGVSALKKLTEGTVHLNIEQGSSVAAFNQVSNAQVNHFSGPHPAGLVGVQIHHIDPINKGDVVWTIQPDQVAMLGAFLETGVFNQSKTIAFAGESVKTPQYYNVIGGAGLKGLVETQVDGSNHRVICGNVLTGAKVEHDGYLNFASTQVTVIPEGNEYEFLGWLFPSYRRPTISNSLPISKFLTKNFKVNTNYHGEERAFVVTGQYDKVLPMDVLAMPLIKSILAQDLEAMENLGIYEVLEEDLALCEFVCTSKMELQQILREGLNLLSEES